MTGNKLPVQKHHATHTERDEGEWKCHSASLDVNKRMRWRFSNEFPFRKFCRMPAMAYVSASDNADEIGNGK